MMRRPLTIMTVLALAAPAGTVLAGPENGVVTQGQARISTPAVGQTRIDQSSAQVRIDWRSFSVGSGEQVTFAQPSASALAINRVTGPDPSAIAGRISANGQVVLINPNGIAFAAGSQVDVNGLIASTADLGTVSGNRLVFDKPSANPSASIVNRGTITVGGPGGKGFAALVGPGVVNDGVIAARAGTVILGGAETYTLDLHGDGLVSFQIDSPTRAVPRDDTGQPLPAAVRNRGRIAAPGGVVVLATETARGVIDRAIDASGVIEATAISTQGGTIRLSGGGNGTVAIDGTLDASANASGARGGTVQVSGQRIAVASTARIAASGGGGGGSIALGGSRSDGARAASRVTVARGATLKADATIRGSGGQIRIWSEQGTEIAGSLSARGGPLGGDGGMIETSARTGLAVSGAVDAGAGTGAPGTWVLDPIDITVDAAMAASIVAALGGGTNTILDAAIPGGGGGTITVNAAIRLTEGLTPVSLTLRAPGAITINAPIESVGGPPLAITASSTSGAITLAGAASLTSGGGAILLQSGSGSIDAAAALRSEGGALTVIGGGGVSLRGGIETGGGALALRSDAGALTLTGGVATVGGSLTLAAATGLTQSGDIDLGNGTASLTLDSGTGSIAGTIVTAGETIDLSGGAGAQITVAGRIASGAAVTVRLGGLTIATSGRIDAATNILLAVDQLTIDTARSFAGDGPAIAASGKLDILPLSAGRDFTFAATSETSAALSITAAEAATFADYTRLTLGRETASDGSTRATMGGTLRIAGLFAAPASLAGLTLASGGDINLEAASALRAPSIIVEATRLIGNNGASVSAISALGFNGGDLVINAPITVAASGPPTLFEASNSIRLGAITGAAGGSTLTLRLAPLPFFGDPENGPVYTPPRIVIGGAITGLGSLTAEEIQTTNLGGTNNNNGRIDLPDSSSASRLGIGTLTLNQITAVARSGVYLTGNLAMRDAVLQTGAGPLDVSGGLTLAGRFAVLDQTLSLTTGAGGYRYLLVNETNLTPLQRFVRTKLVRNTAYATRIAGAVTGAGTELYLFAGRGGISLGVLDVKLLAINGDGASAGLTGRVGGVTGTLAAQNGVSYKIGPVVGDYALNGCPIGSTACLATSQITAGIPIVAPKFDLKFDAPPTGEIEIQSPSGENED